MGKIRLLAPTEVQKIAAGEVVERPANVIKELVENALDAQATIIEVTLVDGGRSLISISDNGSGIDPTDISLALLPHATSKITTVDDLTGLNTFGFRGEALASIAAVSDMTLISRTAGQSHGLSISSLYGKITEPEQYSSPIGTTITIRDLFANVPARKKFLKNADVEMTQIKQLMQAYALTYLHVHFIVRHNGNLVYNCSPVDSLVNRMVQLFDHQIAQHCKEISIQHQFVTVRGIISNHQLTRFNRQQMIFTVNNRWIKNQALAKAVLRGYQGVLPDGRFPVVVLHLQIPFDQLDVNVHPRKEEVQLLHAHAIESCVTKEVARRLEYVPAIKPAVSQKLNELNSTVTAGILPHNAHPAVPAMVRYKIPDGISLTTNGEISSWENSSELKTKGASTANSSQALVESLFEQPAKSELQNQLPFNTEQKQLSVTAQHWHVRGVLDKTYLLVETPDGLWMVDQHAAHERILYNRMEARFIKSQLTRLIIPVTITLDIDDVERLSHYQDFLIEQGIELQRISDKQISVQAVALHGATTNLEELVRDICEILSMSDSQKANLAERIEQFSFKIRAQMACKAAIKAGDTLSEFEQTDLIKQLLACPDHLTCPHGRPTSWMIAHYEIRKNFKRVRS